MPAASRLRGVLLGTLALGFAGSAAPAWAVGPVALESAGINYSDSLRSPYALVPSSYSDTGETEVTVTKSGTYKLEARDAASYNATGNQAIKIPVGGGKNYWIAFRQSMPETETPVNGILLYWTKDNSNEAQLLDTTPGSPAGADDAPLAMGRTFSDLSANLHITPTRRIGTTAVEVTIYMGEFPNNKPPTLTLSASSLKGVTQKDLTFTAQASDPDGDALAYYWDFEDQESSGGGGANFAKATHNWETSADYHVRCTVSDMKGGTASRTLLLRVERLPGIEDVSARHRINGRVTLNGEPFQDAIVRAEVTDATGKTTILHTTLTDSDGNFTFLNVLPGNYQIKVTKAGYTIAPISIPTNRTPDKVALGRQDVNDVVFAATRNP